MAGESYTYCVELDSEDYVSVSCLSDGRVYKIKDLVKKELKILTEKYKVSPDGFISLELMNKPRYKTLWGVTVAGTNQELSIGEFRGKDLAFESLAGDGEPALEVIIPADGRNIRLLEEGMDVSDKWQEHKDAELAGAVFLTYYENYGQACSLFRLTVEDLMGLTGHGKRFLTRLIGRKDVGNVQPQQQVQQQPQQQPAKDARKVAPPAPVNAGSLASTPGAVQGNGEAGTSGKRVSAPVSQSGGKRFKAEESDSKPAPSPVPPASAPTPTSHAQQNGGALTPMAAMQQMKPVLDRVQASKEARWAMGADMAKMQPQQMASFMELFSKSPNDEEAMALLRFYFPDCGLPE